jgi:hypothetical protein
MPVVVQADRLHVSHHRGGQVVKLTEMAKAVKDSLDAAELKKWEASLKVYLGVDEVIHAGFEATLTFSSDPSTPAKIK